MDRKKQLMGILAEYEAAVNTNSIDHLEIHYDNGDKAGIGNNDAIKVTMEALMGELRRQISEL